MLEDIIITPETPKSNETFSARGKITLAGIPFILPTWVICSITGPSERRESSIAVGGTFDVEFAGGLLSEGSYKLETKLYIGPTASLDKTIFPPFPAVDTYTSAFTVSGVAPPPVVCTPGETKCVGYDLYTCGGDERWHLTERNSVECDYVPPPPDGWQPEGVELGRGNFSVEITEVAAEYCTLTITIVPEGVGTVYPESGEYPYGERIDLYAEATDPDYKFLKWGGAASGTDPYTSINMYGDRSVRAEFVKKEIPPGEASFTIRGIFWPPGAAYWRVTWWYLPGPWKGEHIAYNVPISQNAVAVDQPAYGAPEFTVFDRYPGIGVVPIYRSYDRYGHSGLAFEAREGVTYRYDFSTETIRE